MGLTRDSATEGFASHRLGSSASPTRHSIGCVDAHDQRFGTIESLPAAHDDRRSNGTALMSIIESAGFIWHSPAHVSETHVVTQAGHDIGCKILSHFVRKAADGSRFDRSQ
jgi:hypothetical protein